MSEFKFACPVCGQHITADSSNSGGKIECPTCFQKIIVPQAPTLPDPKFILSAAQADKPRPPTTVVSNLPESTKPVSGKAAALFSAAFVLLLCGLGAAGYVFRDKIFKTSASQKQTNTNATAKKAGPPLTIYPVPTNFTWALDLSGVAVPETKAAGRIHGKGFFCEKAILQGGDLTLRQGKTGAADLGVTIHFFAREGEELSGKSIEIATNRPPPLPRITVRYKDESNQKAITTSVLEGYALKVDLGEVEEKRVSGKIYLALPDIEQSFVAGTFEAEVKKKPPPKPKQPKTPKPKAPKQ